MDKTYTKLSALVDSTFKVERVSEYRYKRWNTETNKFEVSDSWQKDFKKTYTLDTDKGLLDVSQGQLANMLEAVSYKGEASLPGKTISVKSNGKTGIDIRYYLNAAKPEKEDVGNSTAALDEMNEGW